MPADFPTDGVLDMTQMHRLARIAHDHPTFAPARLLMTQFEDGLGLSLRMAIGLTDSKCRIADRKECVFVHDIPIFRRVTLEISFST